ncbi:MAG: alkaline phosphatase [Saprospiraceae bacterium]
MKQALFCTFFALFTLLACNPKPNVSIDQPIEPLIVPILKTHPRNIILMIGDGMGLTQITAGMYRNGNKLYLEQFPIIGLHKPYSANNLITDSAAGATAFAAGIKTNNGAIAVDRDTLAVPTILEEAELNGLATGMVTTSTVVHATPAAFIAHNISRNNFEQIAADFLKTDIDLFIGGGLKYFESRKDNRNLFKELQGKGYSISSYEDESFEEVVFDADKKLAYFTADADPKTVAQGRDYLPSASRAAANFLAKRSEKGFFLMIEGAQIDWGGHNKDSDYIISEMLDFNETIGNILQFAKEDGETLVIVTADHETGGYSINPGSTMEKIIPGFTSDYHTATLIPVFAFGPGSELFGGTYENTAIYDKMKKAFGF